MNFFAFIGNLAGPDLIVILLIVLVLFGSKKLPELARGLGQAAKEFQKGKDELSDELQRAAKPTAPATGTVPTALPAATDGSAVAGTQPVRRDVPADPV